MAEYSPHDLGELEKAVNGAATKVAVLWSSFTLLGVYLAITTASITHRDLLLNAAIKMPVLSVDLPVTGYFMVAPVVYWVSHLYLLSQLSRLVRKTDAFQEELKQAVPDPDDRNRARLRLDDFPFVQLLAQEEGAGASLFRVVMVIICVLTGTLAPLLILLQMMLAYLPNHDLGLTWTHRLCIVADLVLAWAIWIIIVRRRLRAPLRIGLGFGGGALTVAVLAFCFQAVFPGEWLYEHNMVRGGADRVFALIPPHRTLSEVLFEGELDDATGEVASVFSNRLVLADAHLFAPAAPNAAVKSVSLRGRNLRNAVFRRADLRQADFAGADLRDASFQQANLQGASFACQAPDSFQSDGPDLDAILEDEGDATPTCSAGIGTIKAKACTQLQGADFTEAAMQGAILDQANLTGANLRNTALQGASAIAADMTAVDLRSANLNAAVLYDTKLRLVGLFGAQAMAADFRCANAEATSMLSIPLQGADLREARLNLASFTGSRLYRARIEGVTGHYSAFMFSTLPMASRSKGQKMRNGETGILAYTRRELEGKLSPEESAQDHFQALDLTKSSDFQAVVDSAVAGVDDEAIKAAIIRRLTPLAPDQPSPQDPAVTKKIFRKKVEDSRAFWRIRRDLMLREACSKSPATAPYVARGLIANGRLSSLVVTGLQLDSRATLDLKNAVENAAKEKKAPPPASVFRPVRPETILRTLRDPVACPGAQSLTQANQRDLAIIAKKLAHRDED